VGRQLEGVIEKYCHQFSCRYECYVTALRASWRALISSPCGTTDCREGVDVEYQATGTCSVNPRDFDPKQR